MWYCMTWYLKGYQKFKQSKLKSLGLLDKCWTFKLDLTWFNLKSDLDIKLRDRAYFLKICKESWKFLVLMHYTVRRKSRNPERQYQSREILIQIQSLLPKTGRCHRKCRLWLSIRIEGSKSHFLVVESW